MTKRYFIQVDDEARSGWPPMVMMPKWGAPYGRLIQEKIKKPLAEEVLFGSLAEKGGTAYISVENDELVLTTDVKTEATA